MNASISISCKGDKRYVAAVKLLAMKRNMSIAALVRKALDETYGSDIEKEEQKFFDPDCATEFIDEH